MKRPEKVGKPLDKDHGLLLQRTAKAKRTKRTKATTPEISIHERFEQYIAERGAHGFHIPDILLKLAFNGMLAPTPEVMAAATDAAADVRGYPDWAIYHRCAPGRSLLVELKTDIGEPTRAQREWEDYGSTIHTSFESAAALLDAWLIEIGAPA